jgi:hypothetical protein
MPSLWRESLGRVAIEAMANGIPVLASDRGALSETLGDAGFVFTIPERCTPGSGEVPAAREVAPWVATSGSGTIRNSKPGSTPWRERKRGDGTWSDWRNVMRDSLNLCVHRETVSYRHVQH